MLIDIKNPGGLFIMLVKGDRFGVGDSKFGRPAFDVVFHQCAHLCFLPR